MTEPALARTSLKTGDRYYGKNHISVTSVLNALPKPYLLPWATGIVAETAVEVMQDVGGHGLKDTLPGYMDEEEGTIEWEQFAKDLSNVWQWERDEAGDMGDKTHEAAEMLLRDSKGYAPHARDLLSSPEYATMIDGVVNRLHLLVEWLAFHSVRVVDTEFTVFNDNYLYAGTCDIAAYVNGIPTVIDIKTGKDIYPEVALQLAAYSRGEYTLGKFNKKELTPFGDELKEVQGAVLHIKEFSIKFIPVRIDDEVFNSFLDCIDIKRGWLDKLSKRVLGSSDWNMNAAQGLKGYSTTTWREK